MIDGLYLDEGFVDIHAVVVNPKIPGQLTIATRFGVFRSDDRGAHWRDLKAPQLRPIGSYCRRLGYAPNDGKTLYLGAANDFDGDRGALFITRDNGLTWEKTEPGVWLKTPIFGLAVTPISGRDLLREQDRPARLFARSRRDLERQSAESGRGSRVLARGRLVAMSKLSQT